MRCFTLALMLVLSLPALAAAEERTPASRPSVAVCDRQGMAERQIKRDHGRAEWTNAAEVLRAVQSRSGWAAPRCMTKLEYWRMTNELDRLRQSERQRAQAARVLASR